MAPDGNEPIRMEAAREDLCPGVDAKGLLKKEEECRKAQLRISSTFFFFFQQPFCIHSWPPLAASIRIGC